MAKSLLFTGDLPFGDVPGCGVGRQEAEVVIRKFGRTYKFVVRDKITVEDPYLVLVKAEAFALQQGELFAGTSTERAVKDFLIRSNVTI